MQAEAADRVATVERYGDEECGVPVGERHALAPQLGGGVGHLQRAANDARVVHRGAERLEVGRLGGPDANAGALGRGGWIDVALGCH